MFDFLKTLFRDKDQQLTIIVLDDEEPDSPRSFQFAPSSMFNLYVGTVLLLIVIVLGMLFITPLGNLIYDQQDQEIVSSVKKITKKMQALEDSLRMRDQQLVDIKQVLLARKDTTFSVNNNYLQTEQSSGLRQQVQEGGGSESNGVSFEMISQNEIIYSNILKNAPDFPAEYPLHGTLTRGFQPNAGHFGIDIAAAEGSLVRVVADGAVINSDWTVNYGYVIHVQHANGIISVYKHCSNLLKNEGDIILKGDIIGTIGRSGVLSSGPHVHFELWKEGIALDPAKYLVKI